MRLIRTLLAACALALSVPITSACVTMPDEQQAQAEAALLAAERTFAASAATVEAAVSQGLLTGDAARTAVDGLMVARKALMIARFAADIAAPGIDMALLRAANDATFARLLILRADLTE